MTTTNPVSTKPQAPYRTVKACTLDDLVLNSGVCVLLEGKQIALFSIIDQSAKLSIFACDNFDPFGRANVLSRGLICSLGAEICICSPLYKQHFSLIDGKCLDDESVSVDIYKVDLVDNDVMLHIPVASVKQSA